MRWHLHCFLTAAFVGAWLSPADAYLMRMLKYEELFERANCVVIATPLKSQVSDEQLKVAQPAAVLEQVVTIDTEFEVAYVLKGKLESKTIHFLHLNRKDKAPVGVFGAVGTFFIDFEAEDNERKSFILFMKEHEGGKFKPAWRPMEGSRAVLPVRKEGSL